MNDSVEAYEEVADNDAEMATPTDVDKTEKVLEAKKSDVNDALDHFMAKADKREEPKDTAIANGNEKIPAYLFPD